MSGASRMGFDLLTKQGCENLSFCMKHRGYSISIRTIADDTLSPLVCKVLGHKPYDSGCPPQGHWCDLACRRCHKYIGKKPEETNEK